jgi:hypothetical protein
MATGLAPALLQFGNDAQLLHQAQIIVPLPLLNYLISFDAVYGDALKHYLLPSRGYALKVPLVSTAYRPACDDLVTLCYLILHGDVEVGEGVEEHGDELPGFLGAADVLIRFVPDEISAVNPVDEVRVVLVDDLPRTTGRNTGLSKLFLRQCETFRAPAVLYGYGNRA